MEMAKQLCLANIKLLILFLSFKIQSWFNVIITAVNLSTSWSHSLLAFKVESSALTQCSCQLTLYPHYLVKDIYQISPHMEVSVHFICPWL